MPRILLAIWKFVVPFLLLMFVWGKVVTELLRYFHLRQPDLYGFWPTVGFGTLLVALFTLGVILSYNLAAAFYRILRWFPSASMHPPQRPLPGSADASFPYERIGLILAGGGAKGAYQAGAMRAIWEFLDERHALERVRMIAGTSIGAWNALFWMAGLVRPPDGQARSAHESWWRGISPDQVLDFDWYLPFVRNHIGRATPWRETFRKMFVEYQPVRERLGELLVAEHGKAPLHFYLTRSNVKAGELEFSTNRWDLGEPAFQDPRTGTMKPRIRRSLYQVLDGADRDGAFRALEEAVFASMDIPPLFPFSKIRDPIEEKDEWFEDGGVIDNLPMRFGTAMEDCDLLFVLPLNASFERDVNRRSILSRLSRAMEVRQGVLERNAFKQAYLYNDLHKLKNQSQVTVFAICPAEPLAVGTIDFHKPVEAGKAYQLMYDATLRRLRADFATLNPSWIELFTVAPDGTPGQTIDDF